MTECILITKGMHDIRLSVPTHEITITAGLSSSVTGQCPVVIKVANTSPEVIVDSSERVRVTVGNKVQVSSLPTAPKRENVFVLGTEDDPCSLNIISPSLVLKAVDVGGCIKYKLLVVGPPA